MTGLDVLSDHIETFLEEEHASPLAKIRLAQALVREAAELAEQAAREINDTHAKATLAAHLAILAGSDHGYLSRDFNFDAWIVQVETEQEAEPEDSMRSDAQ